MAIKLFELGFVLKAITTGFDGAMTKALEQIEALNAAAKATAPLRELSGTLTMIGGGAVAASAAIALPLKAATENSMALQVAQQKLATVLPSGAEGLRQLKEATEAADKVSTGFNVTQEEALEGIRLGISGTLTYQQALAALVPAVQLAKGTFGDIADSNRFLAQTFVNFGDKSKDAKAQLTQFADVTAYVVRQKAFADLGEFNDAMTIALGSVESAKMSFPQAAAALATFSAAGLKGSMAGEALDETMAAIGRGGFDKLGVKVATFNNGAIDVIGTLANLETKFGSAVRTPELFERLSKALNIRGLRALGLDADQLISTQRQLTSGAVNGSAAQGAAIVMGSLIEKMGQLNQQWKQFLELFGLVGPLTAGTDELRSILEHLTAVGKKYPEVTKLVAEFAGFTAAVLGVVGGLALLGASMAFISSYAPVVLAIVNPFRLWALATKAVTAAQWLLNAAMDANPIGLIIVGVAALTAILYELYQHWDSVTAAAKAAWAYLTKIGTEAYDWGVNLLKNLAAGIDSAVMYPVHAIENLAGRMARFLRGHSPIPEGPLRNLNMGIEIARTMQPAPILSAIRRVALVTAIAAPMMVGAGAPALAARADAVRSGGGQVINITVHYNVTAGSPEEFVKAARKHAEELTRIIERRQAVHKRLEWDD